MPNSQDENSDNGCILLTDWFFTILHTEKRFFGQWWINALHPCFRFKKREKIKLWIVLYAFYLQECDHDCQGEKLHRVFAGFSAVTRCLLICARGPSEYLICRVGAGDGRRVVKSRRAFAPSHVSDCAGKLNPCAAESSVPTLDPLLRPPAASHFKNCYIQVFIPLCSSWTFWGVKLGKIDSVKVNWRSGAWTLLTFMRIIIIIIIMMN